MTYNGASSGYFAALDGKDLCGPCPTLPTTDYNYTPAVSGFLVLRQRDKFGNRVCDAVQLHGVYRRWTPDALHALARCLLLSRRLEVTVRVGFTPGSEMGLAAFVYAVSIPDVGPAGLCVVLQRYLAVNRPGWMGQNPAHGRLGLSQGR